MNLQWYPGHMTSAMRTMREDVKLVDLIIELLDARVPRSSRNPDLSSLGAGKGRLILLNKADLADEECNRRWIAHFKEEGTEVLAINAKTGQGMEQIRSAVREACKEKIERDRRRGIKNRPLRAMVAGIPNVGKSSFINSFGKKAAAKTGNKPGVTRGRQWIKIRNELELLDTPGVLWPKFEDPQVGLHLALIGSINDEILPTEELGTELLALLKKGWPGRISARYETEEEQDTAALLTAIGKRLGCLKPGGGIDTLRAARLILDDLRSARLGRISLELPEKE